MTYFEVLFQKWFELRQKKHHLHPRFWPGSVPTFVINTAAAGFLDPSALNRDEKSPFCGLFYSQGHKFLVPGGQNIYGRGDDEGKFNHPEATRSVSVWP